MKNLKKFQGIELQGNLKFQWKLKVVGIISNILFDIYNIYIFCSNSTEMQGLIDNTCNVTILALSSYFHPAIFFKFNLQKWGKLNPDRVDIFYYQNKIQLHKIQLNCHDEHCNVFMILFKKNVFMILLKNLFCYTKTERNNYLG